MKYSEARQGRVFVIRLEDGDVVHEVIEAFAVKHGITAATLLAVGGADDGSRLVVGPEQDRAHPVVPMELSLKHAHEVAGVGTLFPGQDGKPVLHMHMACGRENNTVTGCVRAGVRTWHVLEVILTELTNCSASRVPDETTGFALLQPGE
jgi:predicted DNA-binding protein with PD1-like motif